MLDANATTILFCNITISNMLIVFAAVANTNFRKVRFDFFKFV